MGQNPAIISFLFICIKRSVHVLFLNVSSNSCFILAQCRSHESSSKFKNDSYTFCIMCDLWLEFSDVYAFTMTNSTKTTTTMTITIKMITVMKTSIKGRLINGSRRLFRPYLNWHLEKMATKCLILRTLSMLKNKYSTL